MKSPDEIQRYLAAVPKAELHVHLEGSISPETLLMLARRNRVPLPASNLEELRQWFVFRDLAHFVDVFFKITKCLKTAEDYELIAYEFGKEMKRQNVRYAEVTFSADLHHSLLGIGHDVYFSGLKRGRERAWLDFGVEMVWIFDIIRDVANEVERYRRADFTTRVAIEGMSEGVVALGLGGYEEGYPPDQFALWFEQALAVGLHSVPHAGEVAGPASIWGAMCALKAERIGHGVHAIEDPELVNHLIQQHIPLEICPGSNICLNSYSGYDSHPLPLLYEAGVPLSINSDDPTLFNITLTENLERLHTRFHLSLNEIDEIILNGVRHSFLPPERKQAMEEEFKMKMSELRQELCL